MINLERVWLEEEKIRHEPTPYIKHIIAKYDRIAVNDILDDEIMTDIVDTALNNIKHDNKKLIHGNLYVAEDEFEDSFNEEFSKEVHAKLQSYLDENESNY